MENLLQEILTGLGMGLGIFYLTTQFGLKEVIQYRKYLDVAIFIFFMWMFMKSSSGYMASVTAWAGITVSAALRITGWFIKPQ